MKTAICKHCGQKIGLWFEGQFDERWMHNHEDGPDAYEYCGDDYGMDAEPVEQIV